MRKVIALVVSVLGASLALAPSALAHEGKGEGDRVCRGFAVKAVVLEVADRTIVVAVEKAHPEEWAGGEIDLKVGSRTRYDGDPVAVGRVVMAHGTVCQVDEADEAVFYTKRVKVKKSKLERPRGSFKLAGTVTEASDDELTVQVAEANVAAFVGKAVKVVIGPDTKVAGTPAPGASVVVAGKAKILGGTPVLLATEIEVVGDDGAAGGTDPGGGEPE